MIRICTLKLTEKLSIHTVEPVNKHTINPEKFGVIKISSGIRCAKNLMHEIFLLRRNIAILIFMVHFVSTRVHIHEEPREVLWPCGNTFGVRKTFLILEDRNTTLPLETTSTSARSFEASDL